MAPSDKVGLLPGFRWVVDVLPHWLSPFFGVLATFGMLFALAAVVEGRVWNPSVQYKGVSPGDVFLSLALAASIIAVLSYIPAGTHGWWQTRWWHWVALGIGVFAVLLLKVAEVIATINAPGKPGVYTWGQHFSPTMLWHTLIVPVLGYLVLTLGAAALWSPTVPMWLKLVVVGGFLGWTACALVLDNILARPDVNLIHPSDGWWWQRSHFWRALAAR